MTKPAQSIFVFGIYLIILGVSLIFIPNALLALFGAPVTNEVWIRMVGVLIMLIGYMYIQSARHNIEQIYIITVHTRSSVLFFIAAFVVLEMARPSLILFGIIDMLGAIWTYRTIQRSKNLPLPNQAL